MDEKFVDHQLKALKTASKAKVDRDQALKVFELFDRSPLFFQRWLMKIAINPDLSETEATNAVQADIAEEFGFNRKWLELKPAQRAVAKMVAERVDQIYGQEGFDFITQLTGQPPPSKSSIQAAISRLSRLGHVDKWDDEWRIGDPMFESWIRGRPESEF